VDEPVKNGERERDGTDALAGALDAVVYEPVGMAVVGVRSVV
jgi:hypothetical protein